MARESSATAMDDYMDGPVIEGPSSVGLNSSSEYFSYAQGIFQGYRGARAATEGGQLILTDAFTAGKVRQNDTDEDEKSQARQSVLQVINGRFSLTNDSMDFLSDLLEISFKANAWNDSQYRHLRESLATRASKESLSANDGVSFELEGLVRAVDFLRSEQRTSKAA